MMTERAEFMTPPHRLSPAATYASARDALGKMIGGFRRQGDCPEIVTRAAERTWRWACLPAGHPLNALGAPWQGEEA